MTPNAQTSMGFPIGFRRRTVSGARVGHAVIKSFLCITKLDAHTAHPKSVTLTSTRPLTR